MRFMEVSLLDFDGREQEIGNREQEIGRVVNKKSDKNLRNTNFDFLLNF